MSCGVVYLIMRNDSTHYVISDLNSTCSSVDVADSYVVDKVVVDNNTWRRRSMTLVTLRSPFPVDIVTLSTFPISIAFGGSLGVTLSISGWCGCKGVNTTTSSSSST